MSDKETKKYHKKDDEKDVKHSSLRKPDNTHNTTQGVGNNDRTMLQGMVTKNAPSKDHRPSHASSSRHQDNTSTQGRPVGNQDRTMLQGMVTKKSDSKDRHQSEVRHSDAPKSHYTSAHKDHHSSTEKHQSASAHKPLSKQPSSSQDIRLDKKWSAKELAREIDSYGKGVKDSSSRKPSLDWTQQHDSIERSSGGVPKSGGRLPSNALDWTQEHVGIERSSPQVLGRSRQHIPNRSRMNPPSSDRVPGSSGVFLPPKLDISGYRTDRDKWSSKDRHPHTPAPESTKRTPTNMQGSSSLMKSKAPSFAKSILRTTKDHEMAERQTRIKTLKPDERKEQSKWAQDQLRRRGTCPVNLDWLEVEGGYMCTGEGHAVTHDDLKQGMNGLRFRSLCSVGNNTNYYSGPYYKDNGFGLRGIWRYGGPLPKSSRVPEAYIPVKYGDGDELATGLLPVYSGIVLSNFGRQRIEEFEKAQEAFERKLSAIPWVNQQRRLLLEISKLNRGLGKKVIFNPPLENGYPLAGHPRRN